MTPSSLLQVTLPLNSPFFSFDSPLFHFCIFGVLIWKEWSFEFDPIHSLFSTNTRKGNCDCYQFIASK
jgi:hypothetical protein